MAEYIQRGAAKRAVGLAMDLTDVEYDMICNQIDRLPAADVAPVRHGKWIPFRSEVAGDIWYCSACGIGFTARMAYCPHCGARMGGAE